jgi:hypothetical protein
MKTARFRLVPLLSAAVMAALAAACGGSQAPAGSAPPPSATPAPAANVAPPAEAQPSVAPPAPSAAPAAPPSAPAPAAEPVRPAWKDMTTQQKKEVMKSDVLPHMKPAFQGLDAKRFASMNCLTCHGESAKQGQFTMPNPKLPKLDATGGFAKHKKEDPEITRFMIEHVSPEMAKLIGVEPYNPATHEGFGCFNCHTRAGK